MGTAGTASAEDIKVPPPPQLVTDAWMLYIGFEVDPAAIKAVLPKGLEPHPNNMVVMNMYTVPNPAQTSGFGAYSLTYLTVQVKDQDAYTMGSTTGEPGRYWIGYFNSSELIRKFTREVGIPAEPGNTVITNDKGKLKAVLDVNGKPFIEATADVGSELQPAIGGHLNYFGLKEIQKNGSEVIQIIKFPIPYVAQTVKTENPTVKFLMPKNNPLYRLKPIKVKWASYTQASFVYPPAQVLKEWESTAME
jgi:acetoacetate decarboxylase